MGFSIEDLLSSIMNAELDTDEKVQLLTNIFKHGQTEKEVFIIKNEGEDLFECWRRVWDADNGRFEVVRAYTTAQDTVDAYTASLAQTKEAVPTRGR